MQSGESEKVRERVRFDATQVGATRARARDVRSLMAVRATHHLVVHRGSVPGAGELVEDHPGRGHCEQVAQRRRGFALGGDVVPQLVLEGVLGDVHLLAVAVLCVAISSPYLYSVDGTSGVSDTYEGRERGVASSSTQPPRGRRDHGYFAVGTHLHGGRAASGGSARDAPPGQTRGREELARRERRRHRTRGKVALPCTGKCAGRERYRDGSKG